MSIEESKKRAELLEKLQGITFGAIMTALTTEMCVEAQIFTSEGMSCYWDDLYEWNWPAFQVQPCSPEQWADIRAKLQEHTLCLEDLEDTFFEKMFVNLVGQEEDVQKWFSSLDNLPETLPEYVYCYYDSNVECTPEFFADKQSLTKRLGEAYKSIESKWSDMSTESLEQYWEMYECEAADFPCIVYEE